MHRQGKVWREHALRVISDTGEALVTACAPGTQVRWADLYAKARHAGDDPVVRQTAIDALAMGRWDLADAVWQDTVLLLWTPPSAWFSINAFYLPDGIGGQRLRNWYVNFERPTTRTAAGYDTFDLAVDLVITPDLTDWRWKDEDEYAHLRHLGVITATEHRAVESARAQALTMLTDRTGPFATAEAWATWRWSPDWALPEL
ncbi:DUF402 domain-containing protein [Streptomyces sp. P9-A4]|uniref:DUF402 domain-containing protein n=1 Tax=Streptomyces sp. P9-A4 TaxID=3072285 RepID=UPI002FCA02E7